MRHEPSIVHRVPVEAATHLIVDSAPRHFHERCAHDRELLRIPGTPPVPEQKVQRHRLRKLRGALEAAVPRIVARGDPARGLVELRRRERACAHRRLLRARVELAHALRGVEHVAAPSAVGVGDRAQHAHERRHPVTVRGRVVRAAVIRHALRRQEHRHGPAALPCHRLHGAHVDRVEVRALLTIDLDVHEELVHQRPRSPDPRTIRAPSRGTSDRRRTRCSGESACPPHALARAPPHPTAANQRGCPRAAEGTGSSPRTARSRLGLHRSHVKVKASIAGLPLSFVSVSAPRAETRARRAAWAVVAIACGVRLVVAALVPLVPDETYYWDWSRRLAAGYFDHPPMIALMVRLGTALLGDTALGVRAGCVLTGALASLVLVWIAGEMGGDRARLRAAAMLACMPLTQIALGIATPDPPLILWWSLALAALVYALRDGSSVRTRTIAWACAGIALGLALSTKYTAALLAAGVGIALLSRPELRRVFATPGPYLALAHRLDRVRAERRVERASRMGLLSLPARPWARAGARERTVARAAAAGRPDRARLTAAPRGAHLRGGRRAARARHAAPRDLRDRGVRGVARLRGERAPRRRGAQLAGAGVSLGDRACREQRTYERARTHALSRRARPWRGGHDADLCPCLPSLPSRRPRARCHGRRLRVGLTRRARRHRAGTLGAHRAIAHPCHLDRRRAVPGGVGRWRTTFRITR